MEEKIIKIEPIDPKDFFGPQNKNIKALKINFPDLKIVARGNQIKAFGKHDDLTELELRINKIISYTNNINAERIKEVVGIHKVIYNSDYDEIEIKHSAKNRIGFAP